MSQQRDLTVLLRAVEAGEPRALDDLMHAVYDDLHRVAEKHMRERFGPGMAGVTMEPAALVNESFMRLIRQRNAYDNRGQFFAIATRVMMRVLLDYQRRRKALRRGGSAQRITLSLAEPAAPTDSGSSAASAIDLEDLAEALERLDALDVRKADVVKLRVIWGLRMDEIAESLGVSVATVERDWAFAKAWLAREARDAAARHDA